MATFGTGSSATGLAHTAPPTPTVSKPGESATRTLLMLGAEAAEHPNGYGHLPLCPLPLPEDKAAFL